MSQAVVVHEAYKEFGNPGFTLWKRLPYLNSRANSKWNRDRNPIVVAIDHVSFTVSQGEIFGILGSSGTGKSTLIRLLATLLLPDDGDIRIFGHDVVRQPVQVQRLINRVSVEASFFKKLSPMENLLYGARLYGMNGAETRYQAIEILTRLGLELHAIYQPMEEMSRGMQQKVAIARALLSRPRLLLLDEPTVGLDPRSKRDVQESIRELRDEHGTTILLTTHSMMEAGNMCDRVAILEHGRIVTLGTPSTLKRIIPSNEQEPSMDTVLRGLASKQLVKGNEVP